LIAADRKLRVLTRRVNEKRAGVLAAEALHCQVAHRCLGLLEGLESSGYDGLHSGLRASQSVLPRRQAIQRDREDGLRAFPAFFSAIATAICCAFFALVGRLFPIFPSPRLYSSKSSLMFSDTTLALFPRFKGIIVLLWSSLHFAWLRNAVCWVSWRRTSREHAALFRGLGRRDTGDRPTVGCQGGIVTTCLRRGGKGRTLRLQQKAARRRRNAALDTTWCSSARHQIRHRTPLVREGLCCATLPVGAERDALRAHWRFVLRVGSNR
jgi:hypothetical protein